MFELSVCAGLIPAIFISAISLTRRLTPEGLQDRRREKRRRYGLLPVLVVVAAIALSQAHLPLDFAAAAPAGRGPTSATSSGTSGPSTSWARSRSSWAAPSASWSS